MGGQQSKTPCALCGDKPRVVEPERASGKDPKFGAGSVKESKVWKYWSEQGVEIQYDIYLDDKDPSTPWGLLTLRPSEPAGSKNRFTLESVDDKRGFKIRSKRRVQVDPSDMSCIITNASGRGSYQGKNYMGGQFDASMNTLQGQLRRMQNDDSSPIVFHGRKRESVSAKRPDKETAMSVEQLYQLLPANPDMLHQTVMSDIADAALARYPQEWVDALQMKDAVEGKQVPEYLKRLVDDPEKPDVRDCLKNLITAQVAPNVWNSQDQKLTQAWASHGFSKQQDIKDRCQYYLQAELDKTCLAGVSAYHKIYQHSKAHHTGILTPDLADYINGQGGKTAEEWATALYDHCIQDVDTRFYLVGTQESYQHRHLSKIKEIMEALTAESTTEELQALPVNFMKSMELCTIDFCRAFVAALPLADMQDLVKRQLDLFWQNSQDETVNADVRGALKDCFQALGATTDVAATKDFQAKLVQFLVDNQSGDSLYVTDRIHLFKEEIISKDYSSLNEKDLNRVKNFSTFIIMSLATSIANFGFSAKNTESWSDPDVDSAKITALGVTVMVNCLTLQAETHFTDGKLGARGVIDGFPIEAIAESDLEEEVVDDALTRAIVPSFHTCVEGSFDSINLPFSFGPPEADAVSDMGAGVGPAEGRNCFNWVDGAKGSIACAVAASIICLAKSISELSYWKDVDKGMYNRARAKIVVDTIAVTLNGGALLATCVGGRLVVSGAAAAMGACGFVFLGAGCLLEFIFQILAEKKPTPQQLYIDAVGPFLSSVTTPPEDWLREHQLPDQ